MPSRDYEGMLQAEDIVSHLRESSESILLLDCRPRDSFTVSHIRGAISLTLPASLIALRRLANGKLPVQSLMQSFQDKERFASSCKESTLVIYDAEESSRVFETLQQRLRDEGCRVACLQGGFAGFHDHYPEWCSSPSPSLPDAHLLGLMSLRISDCDAVRLGVTPDSGVECGGATSPLPVEILPHLFLGTASDSSDGAALRRHGIHYVLNVTPNRPECLEEGVKYMQIPVKDHWSQNLASFFPQAIDFIDEARKRKLGVLVHCLAGISRSVTITLAYLMHELNIPLNEAYDLVQRRKANISPNFNFLGQLKDFERELNLSPCRCSGSVGCACDTGSTPDSAVHATDSWT